MNKYQIERLQDFIDNANMEIEFVEQLTSTLFSVHYFRVPYSTLIKINTWGSFKSVRKILVYHHLTKRAVS